MSGLVETALAAKSTLATLAMMAAQGAVLALIAAILARGRVRPAWQAAVWLVVLAKFVLPWGPAMPWSLADLFASVAGGAPGGAAVAVDAHAAGGEATPALAPLAGWLALGALWIAGGAFVVGRAVAGHVRTLRAASRAAEAPAPARELLATLAPRVRARLVIGDAATGPYVVGVFRPTIVIPAVLLEEPALLRAALLHELAHVRRRDGLANVIQLAALAVFWWFPVVRFASRRYELARERACDAWALDAGDVSRPAYARLLVRMVQLRVAAAPALAAPRALDERIAGVLGPPVRPRLGIVHRLAVIAWAMLALGGARHAIARGGGEICTYTPALAEAIRQAHPEADADHDGVLSYDEACDFQAELRRRTPVASAGFTEQVSTREEVSGELLAEPLCCDCDAPAGRSRPLASSTEASCQKEEGADR
jgi:beta-lactamase regulating signal transducer with metallopeptidase domain